VQTIVFYQSIFYQSILPIHPWDSIQASHKSCLVNFANAPRKVEGLSHSSCISSLLQRWDQGEFRNPQGLGVGGVLKEPFCAEAKQRSFMFQSKRANVSVVFTTFLRCPCGVNFEMLEFGREGVDAEEIFLELERMQSQKMKTLPTSAFPVVPHDFLEIVI